MEANLPIDVNLIGSEREDDAWKLIIAQILIYQRAR